MTIENEKVVGHLLTKSDTCHCQVKKNQEKRRANTPECDESTISPSVVQIYKFKYPLLDAEGAEIVHR